MVFSGNTTIAQAVGEIESLQRSVKRQVETFEADTGLHIEDIRLTRSHRIGGVSTVIVQSDVRIQT